MNILLQQVLLESIMENRFNERPQEASESDGPIVEEIVDDSEQENQENNGSNVGRTEEPEIEEIVVDSNSISDVD